MTTINPLGTETFWVNVYPSNVYGTPMLFPNIYAPRLVAGGKVKNVPCWPTFPSYRLKVRPWIPHDGGPCPVAPHVRVRVRWTDGRKFHGTWRADYWSAEPEVSHDQDYWTGKYTPNNVRVAAYQIMED